VKSSDTGDGYNITAEAYCAYPNDTIAGLYTANVSYTCLKFKSFDFFYIFVDIL